MPHVEVLKSVPAAPDELWARIGGFHTFSEWHPAIERQTADGGREVRELHLVGGGTVVETLLDERPQSYTYRIDESPLPVADYTATISLEGSGDGSTVTWIADFVSDGATDEEACAVIEGIFRSGLDAL